MERATTLNLNCRLNFVVVRTSVNIVIHKMTSRERKSVQILDKRTFSGEFHLSIFTIVNPENLRFITSFKDFLQCIFCFAKNSKIEKIMFFQNFSPRVKNAAPFAIVTMCGLSSFARFTASKSFSSVGVAIFTTK